MAATDSQIPRINLLCMQDHFMYDWNLAAMEQSLPSSVAIRVYNCALSQLPGDDAAFDAVVSPANSYGRLDGAFDDAISRAFSPTDDYFALTRVAQEKLYEQWRGMAPPGTCTLVRIPDDFVAASKNVWGTKYVCLCPTMRLPQDVNWDKEVVYECVWSMLNAVANHNRAVRQGKADEGDVEIKSICMTPLATGVGRVSSGKWASQAVLAIKHFVEAEEDPEKWSNLSWLKIGDTHLEIESTWNK